MFSSNFASLEEAFTNTANIKPLKKNNKTRRKKLNSNKNKNVEKFLSSLRDSLSDSDDEEEKINNETTHIPYPIVQTQKDQSHIQKQKYSSNVDTLDNENMFENNNEDDDITKEEFTNYLQGEKINNDNSYQYNSQEHPSNQWIPYFTQTNNNQSTQLQGGEQNELLNKLNYLIHMMEQQKEKKTGHVTEELILYSFLGIFMIFIVDSFTKVSKYSR